MSRTYLLEAEKPSELEPLRHPKWKVRRKWRRAIVVSEDDNVAPPFELVRRRLAGDQMLEQVRSWLSRCILDDLHEAYVRNSPVAPKVARAAVDKWVRARERQAKLRRELEQAVAAEREASAELVRTHGKVAIVIRGVTYYPAYVEDSTTNSQVQGKAGNYATWQPVNTRKKAPK